MAIQAITSYAHLKTHILSWDEITRATDALGRTILASGYKPDYLIGIATGGLIPLSFLSKQLKQKNVLTISAHSYVRTEKGTLKITYMPAAKLRGKRILIIDEIAETGDTLQKICAAVAKKYKGAEVKTATIAVNTDRCKFYPDFYSLKTPGVFTLFPWEQHEFPEFF